MYYKYSVKKMIKKKHKKKSKFKILTLTKVTKYK